MPSYEMQEVGINLPATASGQVTTTPTIWSRKFTVQNSVDSSGPLYLKWGSVPTTAAYAYRVEPGSSVTVECNARDGQAGEAFRLAALYFLKTTAADEASVAYQKST